MLLRILSLSLYFLLFLTYKATALVIKINDRDSVVEQKIHMATGAYAEFGFHEFSINGINYHYIESGTLSTLGISDDEEISFEISSGNRAALDVLTSQRLLNLLSSGWQSVIQFSRHQDIPYGYGGSVPPCSYVMYYLRFNYSCFTELTPEIKALVFITKKLTDVVGYLDIGDIILIKNKENSYDKNGVMFVGNSLFLCWDNQNQRFYLRNSKHLDNDLFPENKQIIRVISVWPKEIPKPEVLMTVLDAWRTFQKNSSETEVESKIRFSAEFAPVSSSNLPSYIK